MTNGLLLKTDCAIPASQYKITRTRGDSRGGGGREIFKLQKKTESSTFS